MDKKEYHLREILKLISILQQWGNVLVNGYESKSQVQASEKLQYCIDYLEKEEGMNKEEIELELIKLNQ